MIKTRSHKTAMNHMQTVAEGLIQDPQTKALGLAYAQLAMYAKQLFTAAEVIKK